MNIEFYFTSFVIGLLGAGHCLGMCGGISAALTFSLDKAQLGRRLQLILSYNLGRILCYTLMGALVAGLGAFTETLGFKYMRVVAGVLMILMALYLSGIWKVLTFLERAGQGLWKVIQPLGQGLLPVKSAYSALLLGAVWGWLPCGLVYTALVFSATRADAVEGAISMLLFGLGTLPAVISGGLVADGIKTVLRGPWFKNVIAVFMFVFGVWTIYSSTGHHQQEMHVGHEYSH